MLIAKVADVVGIGVIDWKIKPIIGILPILSPPSKAVNFPETPNLSNTFSPTSSHALEKLPRVIRVFPSSVREALNFPFTFKFISI